MASSSRIREIYGLDVADLPNGNLVETFRRLHEQQAGDPGKGLLASDLRAQHLSLNATRTSQNPYGIAYEIEGPITTPNGRTVRFCSVWQIDTGSEVPRFITMYPR